MNNSTNTSTMTPPNQAEDSVALSYLITYCVIYPVLCSLGVIGNVFTLAIVCKQKPKTSTTQLIMALSISDIIVLLTRLMYVAYRISQIYFSVPTIEFSRYVPSYAILLINILVKRVSKFLLIPISVERLIAVWFPFKVKIFCTRTKALVVVTFIVVIVGGMGFPNLIDVIITHRRIVSGGGEVFVGSGATVAELVRHYGSLTELMSLMFRVNRFAFDFFPLLFVLFSNVLIIVGIRLNNKRMDRSSSTTSTSQNATRRGQTKQVTRMLLSMCCAFVVLALPGDSLSLAVNFFNVINISSMIYIVSDILASTNHAINFVLYFAFNSSYRQRYIELLLCRSQDTSTRSESTLNRSKSQSIGSFETVSKSQTEITSVSRF